MKRALLLALLVFAAACHRAPPEVVPGESWSRRSPEAVGLDASALDRIARYLRGDGFVARYGHQVFTWGDPTRRWEAASASKPVYSTFLLLAADTGRLSDLDAPVATFRPCLREINAERGHPD